MKVLVCDPVSPKGIALLQQRSNLQVQVLEKRLSEELLLPIVADVSAIVVRSETRITRRLMEAAPLLRVVGRAGGLALARIRATWRRICLARAHCGITHRDARPYAQHSDQPHRSSSPPRA